MRLTFVGHACFLAVSEDGLRVLLDPYQPGAFGGKFGLQPFTEAVDVLASTHDHLDHFHLDPAFGDPAIIRGGGMARGVSFQGLRLPHDAEDGAKRGFVTGLRFALDNVAIVHPGDLGRPFTPPEVAVLSPADVLLLPVGGTFTTGPEEGLEAARRLNPRFVVPMHFRLPAVDLPLRPLEDFLAVARHAGWPVQQAAGDTVHLAADTLPERTTVLVMRPTH